MRGGRIGRRRKGVLREKRNYLLSLPLWRVLSENALLMAQFPRKLCLETSRCKCISSLLCRRHTHLAVIWAICHTANGMQNIWIGYFWGESSLMWRSSFYHLNRTLWVASKLKTFPSGYTHPPRRGLPFVLSLAGTNILYSAALAHCPGCRILFPAC